MSMPRILRTRGEAELDAWRVPFRNRAGDDRLFVELAPGQLEDQLAAAAAGPVHLPDVDPRSKR